MTPAAQPVLAPPPLHRADQVRAPAPAARLRRRHVGLGLSFALGVLAPVAAVAVYLWAVAVDQYASTLGFSVRTEEFSSPIELLGGITELSGSSSSDTDILYAFVQSQNLIATLDDRLDLAAIWSRPESDPVFAYDPSGSIEDLVRYWPRMVRVDYDAASGLIDLRVLAFTPQDATRIAEEIFTESNAMINALSSIARDDAVRHAEDEVAAAVDRLKSAREAVTRFRNRNQMVDPGVDLQTQAGLLGNLQSQLAEALIELDMLGETTRDNDPRVTQASRRVDVIEARIAEERRKRGIAGDDAASSEVYADLVGEYERLIVDREFAERTYTSALAALDAAQAESRRQSRYLAAHVRPTTAERAVYPRREVILGLTALFIALLWSMTVLIFYSLRDRR